MAVKTIYSGKCGIQNCRYTCTHGHLDCCQYNPPHANFCGQCGSSFGKIDNSKIINEVLTTDEGRASLAKSLCYLYLK